jgi:hypothetical protein
MKYKFVVPDLLGYISTIATRTVRGWRWRNFWMEWEKHEQCMASRPDGRACENGTRLNILMLLGCEKGAMLNGG